MIIVINRHKPAEIRYGIPNQAPPRSIPHRKADDINGPAKRDPTVSIMARVLYSAPIIVGGIRELTRLLAKVLNPDPAVYIAIPFSKQISLAEE